MRSRGSAEEGYGGRGSTCGGHRKRKSIWGRQGRKRSAGGRRGVEEALEMTWEAVGGVLEERGLEKLLGRDKERK